MHKLLLPLLFICSISLADTKTVAISYFDNTSGTKEYDPLSKGLADMLITDLSNVKSLKIVEREKLESLLKEIELGDGKFIDPNTAQKLGKGLGASYMLTGSFLIMGETMRIDARLVDVGTGEVTMAEEITGEKDTFFELEKVLKDKLIKSLNIELSRTESRKIKKSQTESFEAFNAYSSSLEAFDKGEYEKSVEFLEKATESDEDFEIAWDKLEEVETIIKNVELAYKDDFNNTINSFNTFYNNNNNENLFRDLHELIRKLFSEANPQKVIELISWFKSQYPDVFLTEEEWMKKYPHKRWYSNPMEYFALGWKGFESAEQILDHYDVLAKENQLQNLGLGLQHNQYDEELVSRWFLSAVNYVKKYPRANESRAWAKQIEEWKNFNPNLVNYIGEKKNKRDWVKTEQGCLYYTYQIDSKIKWSGDCKDGRINGEGKLLVFSRDGKIIYEFNGEIRKGQFGNGWYDFKDGSERHIYDLSLRNDIWNNGKKIGYIKDINGNLVIGEVSGFDYNPIRYLVNKDNEGNIKVGIVSRNNFIEYLDIEEVEKYFKMNYQDYEIEHFIPFSKILN